MEESMNEEQRLLFGAACAADMEQLRGSVNDAVACLKEGWTLPDLIRIMMVILREREHGDLVSMLAIALGDMAMEAYLKEKPRG